MKARILIVDDTTSGANPLENRLVAEDYQTSAAPDGAAALAQARSGQPDLIILGARRPELDAHACCRQLKSDADTRHIPVVMITSLGDAADRVAGLEAGADDFLTGSVEDATLMARIHSLVRLKRLFDEWRARNDTIRGFGLAGDEEAEPGIAGAHALVIDDWELAAQTVQDALARAGVIAGRARGATEALVLSAGIRFDLIVLNLGMAEEDPLELVSSLRTTDPTHETPVLLLAEPGESARVVRAFELGANDWLVLPLDENELRARARNQIRRKFYQDRLRSAFGSVTALALIDKLTGLHNRHYLLRHLRRLLAGPPPVQLALLTIDVDQFKRINDAHGRDAGDDALRGIAASLRAGLRASDSIARYDDEAFVVVMPGARPDDAMAAAERLRQTIATLPFEPVLGQRWPLTVSIGIACSAQPALSAEALLQASDQALYGAKQAGRNRVRLADAV